VGVNSVSTTAWGGVSGKLNKKKNMRKEREDPEKHQRQAMDLKEKIRKHCIPLSYSSIRATKQRIEETWFGEERRGDFEWRGEHHRLIRSEKSPVGDAATGGYKRQDMRSQKWDQVRGHSQAKDKAKIKGGSFYEAKTG